MFDEAWATLNINYIGDLIKENDHWEDLKTSTEHTVPNRPPVDWQRTYEKQKPFSTTITQTFH
jgi:hypothetical protein